MSIFLELVGIWLNLVCKPPITIVCEGVQQSCNFLLKAYFFSFAPSCVSHAKVEVIRALTLYVYLWILCLSAGEKLVALSDLSRERGAGAMCE